VLWFVVTLNAFTREKFVEKDASKLQLPVLAEMVLLRRNEKWENV